MLLKIISKNISNLMSLEGLNVSAKINSEPDK